MDNDKLPPSPRYETRGARADALGLLLNGVFVPVPAGSVDDLEQTEGARDAPEVPSNTEPSASVGASRGPVPNDAQFQLVLRNAHPLYNESLSLHERVDAFNSLERERKESADRWKEAGQLACECGLKHPPPHLSQEHKASLNKAYKKGKQLRKQLAKSFSQNDVTMADASSAAPSAPAPAPAPASASSDKKGKSVRCTRCAKWHAGGSNACRAPHCERCNGFHASTESCDDAGKRFARFKEAREAKGKSPALPTPSSSTAVNFNVGRFMSIVGTIPDTEENNRMLGSLLFSSEDSKTPDDRIDPDRFWAIFNSIPGTEENMKRLASIFTSFVSGKRPAGSSPEQQQQKKKKSKKTGQGNTCSDLQFHQKGPPKPDDKGKGRATRT